LLKDAVPGTPPAGSRHPSACGHHGDRPASVPETFARHGANEHRPTVTSGVVRSAPMPSGRDRTPPPPSSGVLFAG
jgi:hypothetical protein